MDLKKRKSIIATDTPEKEEIAARKQKEKYTPTPKKIVKITKKILESSDEEKNEEGEESFTDSEEENSSTEEVDNLNIEEGKYVIAKVYGKKSTSSRNYVGRILEKLNRGYTVKFLKRQFPSYRFKETEEDEALVDFKDVVLVLPSPLTDTRVRFHNMIYFNFDLWQFSIV